MVIVSGIVFGRPHFSVEVDESLDTIAFKDAIGGIIIHGGVQAYVFNKDCRHMFFQFIIVMRA